jgi:murein DD-endopeptidase MepM/ murein hydrolase activator NlpD
MKRYVVVRRRRRNNRFIRLFLATIPLFCILCFVFLVIPQTLEHLANHGDVYVEAAEATSKYFASGKYVPDGINISDDILEVAKREGISQENLVSVILAAAKEDVAAHHLLGLMKVESAYCRNIGTGVAYTEGLARLDTAPAAQRKWWQTNLNMLKRLADNLGIDIMSIPGSKGAGAISCFQVMPANWFAYGGGDYRDTHQSAIVSARYLKAHGYDKANPGKAIRSYNYYAGQPYVDSVMAGAKIWEKIYYNPRDVTYSEVKPGLGSLISVFMEFLAHYSSGGAHAAPLPIPDLPTPVEGEFVHPYPGSQRSSYHWRQPVYSSDRRTILIYHPGQDYVNPQDYNKQSGGPILAAHDGKIVFAEYLPRQTNLAARWWISGNTVVIRAEFADGTPLCTFYGHGAPNTIRVTVGQNVIGGQELMKSGTTGFSTGVHLHFAVMVGGSGDFCDSGKFVDPNDYVK